MVRSKVKLLIGAIGVAAVLGGCGVVKTTAKVASLPVKGAYKTTELTTKGVYGTGKFAAKGVYGTGKTVYYVGKVPVEIADGALDTTAKVLTITTTAVDLTGKVVTVSRDIQAYQLDKELSRLKLARNVIKVAVSVSG